MANNNAHHLINHVLFIIDKSGSMGSLTGGVIRLFDEQVEFLSKRSRETDQETRVSVFLFGSENECAIYDMDVLRVPSLNRVYRADGGRTALIDATIESITDLRLTPEKYGDHAFLTYVITDGYENCSRHTSKEILSLFEHIPNNWTVACLVPDNSGQESAINFGFLKENIALWECTDKGLSVASELIQKSTENFMSGRSKGVRKVTGGIFVKVDLSRIDKVAVTKNLSRIPFQNIWMGEVKADSPINSFVENVVKVPFVKGQGFYMLMKTETVQGYKEVCIRDKRNGNIYHGDEARKLLGLPDTDCKVKPEAIGDYDVYVQSTSSNRKLIKGTKFLYLLK